MTRANAIRFTGGTNRLQLQAGSNILGNVQAFSTADTFQLGGSTNATFNVSSIGTQYSGFGIHEKVGSSTWILTGTTTAMTSWQLLGGTLSVSSDANLGGAAGGLTFDGGILQVTGTSFTSTPRTITWGASGGGIDIADAANTFTLSQSLTGSGPLAKLGAGTLLLTGNSLGFAGTTSIEAGTLSVNGSLCGDVNVASGGRLQGTGTVCDTTNAGAVAPGNSIGTLTVAGDYAGTGGILEIETILSGTGSPADRLLITGNTSGTTTIQTINLGGTGALTGRGNTDGVSIVQVGGTSTASAFQLQGGYAAAGPYQYHLNTFAPGVSAASEADPLLGTVTFWDYRLQSAVDADGDPVPVPQIAAYQGLPSGALRYGSSTMDSLHKRLGEIHHLTAYRADQSREPTGEVFLRNRGSRSAIAGDKGPDYDQNIWFIQFGGNALGWDIGDRGASLRVGAAISMGGSDLDVKRSSAEVDLDAKSLALTTTYQAAQGWYLDAVAQANSYTTNVATDERGQVGHPDGWGWGASLEGGYPIDLGNNLVIEPQAQLAYQQVTFDRFTDVDNLAIDLHGGESLRGRIGGRVQKTFTNEQTLWSPYIEVNALHEFLDSDGIMASGVTFDADNGGTSVQLGGGLNAQLSAETAIFANVSYDKAVTDGAADTWSGTLGLRLSF